MPSKCNLLDAVQRQRPARCVAYAVLAMLAFVTPPATADGVAQRSTIVTRPLPADTLGHFFSEFEPGSSAGLSYFQRAFGSGRPGAVQPRAFAEQSRDDVRVLMVVGTDPNFERWQKEANERLKQERVNTIPVQHPFAKAHPEKSVVVCEAGCGLTTIDQIVYMAAVVPAVLPVANGHLQVNATGNHADPAAAELEDGELPCIAGCYGNSAQVGGRERRIRESSAMPASPKRSNAAGGEMQTRVQIGYNGAIVDQRGIGGRAAHAIPAAVSPWRTKIAFARRKAPSPASGEWLLVQSNDDH